MDLQSVPYDVCRRYVEDLPVGQIGEEETKLILGWIRQRNLELLSSCGRVIPEKTGCAKSQSVMRILAQVEAFFKKNALYADPVACEAAALRTFSEGERKCRITNKRLDHYYTHPSRLDSDMRKWMDRCTAYVERVLGPFEPFLNDLPRLVRFTAGASVTRPRREALPPFKVSKRPVCTHGAEIYIQSLAKYFGYGKVRIRACEYNRVTTVPKNWKTDRTIACEADGNIPLQLAFDTYVKQKLRRVGIDLGDQSKNRELAREASIDGSMATVDLKSASDTLAYNAVAWILPREWFNYLCDVRAPYYKFLPKGGGCLWGRYAKFSSMGNGSTFGIETLLFASACYAVGSKRFSVYGDDIVIESGLFENLKRLLAFLGFDINVEKTFHRGPFRESCGGNFYEGTDITPFYIREIDRRKAVWAHNVNGLASIAEPGGKLWGYLADHVVSLRLPLVPFNGDTLSGVHIAVTLAYEQGLITNRNRKGKVDYIQKMKALRLKVRQPRRVSDSRALFLWHLSAHKSRRKVLTDQDLPPEQRKGFTIEEPLITSRYTQDGHKYVLRWVGWYHPPWAAAPHLFRWGAFLVARLLN